MQTFTNIQIYGEWKHTGWKNSHYPKQEYLLSTCSVHSPVLVPIGDKKDHPQGAPSGREGVTHTHMDNVEKFKWGIDTWFSGTEMGFRRACWRLGHQENLYANRSMERVKKWCMGLSKWRNGTILVSVPGMDAYSLSCQVLLLTLL